MLTGAAIATQIPPPIGLPLAFLSHFALDAIPHYDGLYPNRPYKVLPVLQVLVDFRAGLAILSFLTKGDINQNYLVIASLIAILPDIQAGLYYNYKFLTFLKPVITFHVDILQSYKPPIWVGLATTIAVTLIAIWVISI